MTEFTAKLHEVHKEWPTQDNEGYQPDKMSFFTGAKWAKNYLEELEERKQSKAEHDAAMMAMTLRLIALTLSEESHYLSDFLDRIYTDHGEIYHNDIK